MTIKLTEEIRESLNKVGATLARLKPTHYAQARRYFREDGKPVKLYADRGGTKFHFDVTTNQESQEALEWCMDVIRSLFNLNISTSVLFRRTLLSYQDELLDMMLSQKDHSREELARYFIKLKAEREKLYGVSKRKK